MLSNVLAKEHTHFSFWFSVSLWLFSWRSYCYQKFRSWYVIPHRIKSLEIRLQTMDCCTHLIYLKGAKLHVAWFDQIWYRSHQCWMLFYVWSFLKKPKSANLYHGLNILVCLQNKFFFKPDKISDCDLNMIAIWAQQYYIQWDPMLYQLKITDESRPNHPNLQSIFTKPTMTFCNLSFIVNMSSEHFQ